MPLPGNARTNALETLPPGFVHRPDGADPASYTRVDLLRTHVTFDPARVGGGRALYSTRIAALAEWARINGCQLTASHAFIPEVTRGTYTFRFTDRLPDKFVVYLNQPVQQTPAPGTLGGSGFATWTETSNIIANTAFDPPRSQRRQPIPSVLTNGFECHLCGEDHPYGTLVCPYSYDLCVCPSCGTRGYEIAPRYGADNWPTGGHPLDPFSCSNCGARCGTPGCNIPTSYERRYCDEHALSTNCSNCARVIEWFGEDDEPHRLGSRHICEDCENYLCVACNRISENSVAWSDAHDGNICITCRHDILRRENEVYDVDAGYDFARMPTIEGRERIRLCGVEIEGGNGVRTGSALAADFYTAGLSSASQVVSHQSGDRYGFAHVENDSTVDWEAVLGPINMADTTHVEWLDTAVKQIRARVHSGDLTLDLRCGLHIHVSAERVGLAQAYNLSHLFTYIEDPFFRLAAARWPFHRASQGSTHCAPIPKHDRKLAFYQNQGGRGNGRDNHYYALSFMNYFNSMMRNCRCGAVGAGMWDECTCSELGKCTFEFRLFNTTANPKKILAYLALCQALVAKAIDLPEFRNPADDFPLLEFNRTVLKEMEGGAAATLIEAWKPRVRYILNELPLTVEEKEAVLYCIRNSELAALGEVEIERLSVPEEVAA